MRKLVVAATVSAAVAAFGTASASAATTGTTGQPNQSCQAEPSSPPGLNTTAFLNTATSVYAGAPGTPSATNGNSHAVSQYDVACFQVSH